jgi:hypothetical protein
MVWISCPAPAIPAAGRYVLAWSSEEMDAPLGTTLFQAQASPGGFLAAPPTPNAWQPGTRLTLRGPSGQGFMLPDLTRRLALAALGELAERLQPLAIGALEKGMAVALFTDRPPSDLPVAVEINPLKDLPEALAWADFLACDLPAGLVEKLPKILGLPAGRRHLPCPAQALVLADMPCAGIARCGACGVPTLRGWKLACEDGPVFDLAELLEI